MKNSVRTLICNAAIFSTASSLALYFQGCAGRHAVLAVTGTVIGVEISQNPQTQMYQAKLGYNRGEVAVVPSNRSAEKEPGSQGNGAVDTPEVVMELKYSGIFSTSGGIYQRLAVGRTAVSQPGAAFMFAKDDTGNLDESKARAISLALTSVPESPEAVSQTRAPLAKAFAALASTKESKFNEAAQKAGYLDFRSFLLSRPATPTAAQIQNVRTELEKDPEIKTKLAEIDAGRQP